MLADKQALTVTDYETLRWRIQVTSYEDSGQLTASVVPQQY